MTIRRYDKQNHYHRTLLEEIYHDPSSAAVFRRAPKDLADSALAELETLCGIGLFVMGDLHGFCILSDINPYGRNCQIGIVLKKEWRDKTTKLARNYFIEFCDYIFRTTTMEKLSVTTMPENNYLGALLKAEGWHLESVLVDNIFFQNEWHTETGYAISRKEFYQAQEDAK